MAQRYKSLAIIKDISAKTPARIRLTNMTVEMGPRPEEPTEAENAAGQPAASAATTSKKMIVLEGVVFGESATLEPALAEYLMQLESSP